MYVYIIGIIPFSDNFFTNNLVINKIHQMLV